MDGLLSIQGAGLTRSPISIRITKRACNATENGERETSLRIASRKTETPSSQHDGRHRPENPHGFHARVLQRLEPAVGVVIEDLPRVSIGLGIWVAFEL
jgi:hypothetical protein